MTIDSRMLWGLGSTILIAIGSVGPWITAGPFSLPGTEFANYGSFTVGIAVVAFAIVALRLPYLLATIPALGAFTLGAIAIVRVLRTDNTEPGTFSSSIGWGLLMVTLAAASLLAWALIAALEGDQEPEPTERAQ